MTLLERLKKPDEIWAGTDFMRKIGERPRTKLETEAAVRLDTLEMALHRIAGHGNITGERAREIASEALGIAKSA